MSVSSGVLTLVAAGDLDLAERARFAELVATTSRGAWDVVVVDLCAVGFVDSAGAAFLVSVAAATRRHGGRTVLRGASEAVVFVLEVCGALACYELDAGHRCPPVTSPGPWRSTRAPG